ncbi:protein obstructor-E-like [Hyposmocoma kahamanoa]|uniref:protein obstructor-E-like n=1 Tax=Hyposmocoma kahamanoa TaxID=1477025 RepID=UPI000E6D6C11|nr:protein obstructor-E-like [Hyposmocoma kahamanoa]
MDAPCQGRGAPQPAQPTADCPHQYGFFQSPNADAMHCGSYRMCVEGKAIEMQCPPGLAFNSDNVRCDWPDLVPSCNAEQYLGFQCPPAPIDDDGNPMDVVNYAYKGNCYAFYSCEHGRPRFLTCDQGFAFDSVRGHCVNEKEVQCAVSMEPH